MVFHAGDEISTEISCKYTRDSFARMLPGTCLTIDHWYMDDERLFALALLRRTRAPLSLA
jgi:L-histidine N-alpha-methyltransferase